MQLWEASTGKCGRALQGHSDGVGSVSLSAAGDRIASGSGDGSVRLWEASTGKCIQVFQGHTEGVSSVSLSADGQRIASGGGEGKVQLWEVSTGNCLSVFRPLMLQEIPHAYDESEIA